MEELFNGYGLRLVLETATNPEGKKKQAAILYRADSVHIIAFKDPTHILLLREYRPFYGEYLWMLPSGKVDKEKDILVGAQRELQEETGFKAESLTHYTTTKQTESIQCSNHVFIARDLSPAPLPQDDHELIEVHTCTFPDAIDKVLASPIIHTVSAYALLRYAREHNL